MYPRESRQRRADGSTVSYLQLAENVWNAERRRSEMRVLLDCGRADDRAVTERLRRLARSIMRRCSTEELSKSALTRSHPTSVRLIVRPEGVYEKWGDSTQREHNVSHRLQGGFALTTLDLPCVWIHRAPGFWQDSCSGAAAGIDTRPPAIGAGGRGKDRMPPLTRIELALLSLLASAMSAPGSCAEAGAWR